MRYSTSSEKQANASLSNRKSTVASIFNVLGSKQAEDIESGQDFQFYGESRHDSHWNRSYADFVRNTEIVFEILNSDFDEETIKSDSIEMLPKMNLADPLSIRSISFEDDLLTKRDSF